MNILIPFTILVLSWSIDSTDPSVQKIIVSLFIGVHVLAVLSLGYLFVCIWLRSDNTKIEVTDQYTKEKSLQPAWEYDVGKLRDIFFTKIGMPAGISLFTATRFGLVFPLLLQCFNNPKAIYESELFQIYVLNKEAEGPLQRPWKENSVMPDWLQNMWTQSEKESESMLGNTGTVATSGTAKTSRKRK